MSSGRFFYVEALKDILEAKLSLSNIKNNVIENDKAFFNMLFMTTLRNLTFIKNEVLPQFVKKKIQKKQEILEYVLYLGAVEILFLKTPSYAVINSYVEIAKKKTDKFGANFVNAVLRNIDRKKDEILENRKSGYFSKNFIDILKKDYTDNEIKQIEEYVNIEPMLDLTYKKDVIPNTDKGIKLYDDSLKLPSSTKVEDIEGFRKGDFWVQDLSSSMAVRAMRDNLENLKVLDLCAAPGGKTAQLLSKGANVVAVDIAEDRLEILKENMKRLNLENNLSIVCTNALEFNWDEKFDIVLVDAPCSATGTYRRHPEIIHTKTPKDVKKMADLQIKILQHAKSFLNNNGFLVYATCSLAKDEGERVIERFLSLNDNFIISKIKIKKMEQSITKEGFLRILPYHLKDFFGTDGFFVACLQRKN